MMDVRIVLALPPITHRVPPHPRLTNRDDTNPPAPAPAPLRILLAVVPCFWSVTSSMHPERGAVRGVQSLATRVRRSVSGARRHHREARIITVGPNHLWSIGGHHRDINFSFPTHPSPSLSCPQPPPVPPSTTTSLAPKKIQLQQNDETNRWWRENKIKKKTT